MTIGEGMAYSVFWLVCGVSFIAWLWFRSPKHRHKWKETGRDNIVRRNTKIGTRVYCVCDDCGEPRSFNL